MVDRRSSKGERTDEFAGVRVKVNGRWRELPRPSPVEYADVVVRLSPIEADLALPDLSRNGFRRGTKPKGRVLKERGTPWFLVWGLPDPWFARPAGATPSVCARPRRADQTNPLRRSAGPERPPAGLGGRLGFVVI
ncbi:MAG: hypothetical protein U0835_20480 [Isosphaeraceae bacterium]